MNEKLRILLDKYKPSKTGIHGEANCYATTEYYQRQFDEWQQCGFSWFKLLVAGDSGVNTIREMRKRNLPIIPVIRFWFGERCYPGATLAPDQIKPYVDAWGEPLLFETQNEFYAGSEYAGNMPSNWPDLIAHEWAVMTNAIINGGGIPCTPAIEGWNYDRIFVPLWNVLTGVGGYRALVEQSVVAGHWRTLDHFPTYMKDPGGYMGWTWVDKYIQNTLGHSLPLLGTEAGPEVGWDQDKTFPPVTPESHKDMCLEMIRMKKPDYYLGDCFWLWQGSGAWAQASWKANSYYGGKDLPVIDAFKQEHEMVNPTEPTPDVWSEEEAEKNIRRWCYDNAYPEGINFNPDAAFQKGKNLGAPVTKEMHLHGWAAQGFSLKIRYCKEDDWGNLKELLWSTS